MKKDDDRHCSECVHYEVCPNYQMYCKALQKRITGRKTPRYCKYYKSFIKSAMENNNDIKQSLYDIQPGDKVYFRSNYFSTIYTVDRVTPTLIICNNTKFRKSDGNKTPAERYNYSSIEVLTPKLLNQHQQKVMRANLVRQFKEIQPDRLTNEQLQQIIQITQLPNSDENI